MKHLKRTKILAAAAGLALAVTVSHQQVAHADDFGTALDYYGARMGLDCGFYRTPVRDHTIYQRSTAKADGSGGKQWQSFHWSNCQDVDAVIFDYDARCVVIPNRFVGSKTYRADPGHWLRLDEGTSMTVEGFSTGRGCASDPYISTRLHRLT